MSRETRSPLEALTLLEEERSPDGAPRFLFLAGEGRPRSALARLAASNAALARTAHALCRRCKDVASSVYELAHDPLEALAILACHGWPTPLVLTSASAGVAARAAAASRGERLVVTAIDREELPDSVIARDSSVLGLGGGLPAAAARWRDERGVVLAPREWRRHEAAVSFVPNPEALSFHALPRSASPPADPVERTEDGRAERDRLRHALSEVGRKAAGPSAAEALAELLRRF